VSNVVDPQELSGYVSRITDGEILEDLSHLFEINIVTSALASTGGGRRYKLPLQAVDNINKAFKVYRDELASRALRSDVPDDTGYLLLGEYYRCIKMIRALTRYIDRVLPQLEKDHSRRYTDLYQSRVKVDFTKQAIEE
jgi:hypothetical protein